ncbi:MAG: 1,4-alpha-glucan branching protein domain-containing protein, partial [Myxococcota bacterium]
IRRNLGLKYHRITGKVALSDKQAYVPTWAREKAAQHAEDFLQNRKRQCHYIFEQHGYRPHLTAPYDAELFGHWWYEGPMFLEFLFRKAAFDQDSIQLITQEHYLQQYPDHEVVSPALSSWGAAGYYEVWLNGTNAWIYPHLHQIEENMTESVVACPHPTPYQQRILKQMARELVLAQSSDWAFIMTQETTVPYAVKRTRDHIHRFHTLHQALRQGTRCEKLSEWEAHDNIFPEIDSSLYHPQRVQHPNAGNAVWSVG